MQMTFQITEEAQWTPFNPRFFYVAEIISSKNNRFINNQSKRNIKLDLYKFKSIVIHPTIYFASSFFNLVFSPFCWDGTQFLLCKPIFADHELLFLTQFLILAL